MIWTPSSAAASIVPRLQRERTGCWVSAESMVENESSGDSTLIDAVVERGEGPLIFIEKRAKCSARTSAETEPLWKGKQP